MKLYKQLILNTKGTKNQRIYPLEVLESIKNQINLKDESLNLGTIGYPDESIIDITNAAFKYSNAVIEDNKLYVDIDFLDNPIGDELKDMKDKCFRTAGYGTLKGNYPSIVSHDYKITGIAAINTDDDAIIIN